MELPGSASLATYLGMDVTEQHAAEGELQMVLHQQELILSAVGR